MPVSPSDQCAISVSRRRASVITRLPARQPDPLAVAQHAGPLRAGDDRHHGIAALDQTRTYVAECTHLFPQNGASFSRIFRRMVCSKSDDDPTQEFAPLVAA